MPTPTQWLAAARPRTLPAAIAPVLVGTGCADLIHRLNLGKAALALVVALALQVGVNYANDYSDGIRGTDAARIGPARLVGSGAASPGTVRRAAFLAFGMAGAAGLALAATTSWWLLLFGAAAVAAAWFYTGGPLPYGYYGFGEVFVFTFFGLLAVSGTMYVQARQISLTAWVAAIGIGLLACALLMVNNLRDLEPDRAVGKHTLAVLLGDRLSRVLLVVMVAGAFVAPLSLAVGRPWILLTLIALLLALPPLRSVLGGQRGPILVVALGQLGRLEIGYAVLLTLGLMLSR